MSPVVRDLQEQSTWRLLGLSIITYFVYGAFYTRRQTLKLNHHLPMEHRISLVVPDIVIGLNLLSLAAFVPYLFVEEGHVIETLSTIVDIPASISFLVWAFAARNRMNRLLSAKRRASHWFHGLWTFLFSLLYFNYKVNSIASETPAAVPAA